MNTRLRVEVAKVLDRLDKAINETPTSELRELLTDTVIVIQALEDEAKL